MSRFLSILQVPFLVVVRLITSAHMLMDCVTLLIWFFSTDYGPVDIFRRRLCSIVYEFTIGLLRYSASQDDHNQPKFVSWVTVNDWQDCVISSNYMEIEDNFSDYEVVTEQPKEEDFISTTITVANGSAIGIGRRSSRRRNFVQIQNN